VGESLFITCPMTGEAVSTGFRADDGASAQGLARMTIEKCPACGGRHAWNGADAYAIVDTLKPWQMWRLRST
jgi:hypothetical protein